MIPPHTIAAYAGYLSDSKELLECSSGGIATALSREMINKGGYVAGVSYTDDYKAAEYRIINNENQLYQFKGSKYIGVNKNSIYSDVKDILDQGQKVLFFGTPCIVSALNVFLKNDYENLVTVELICHGPTDPKVHKQYVEYLENKYNSRVVDFSIKRKKDKWTPQYLYAKLENGNIYEERFYHTEYGYAFSAMSLPQCYSCKFRGDSRTADIMIGDFWGANESDPFWNEKGVSAILIHTQKGKNFLLSTDGIVLFPSTYERILEKNQNIINPRAKTKVTDKFTKLFENSDLFDSVKHSKPLLVRIKSFIKKLL